MLTLRNIIIGGVLAVAVIAVAGAAGWWFFIREDAQLATSAPAIPSDLKTPVSGSTQATSSTATSGSGGGTTFVIIGDRSEAAYFADEKLAALPLPSKAKGTTNDITGQFVLAADGTQFDASTPATFTVDLTTLKSDKSMRDSRVQNEGLQTSRFPTATFTATSVTGYDPSIPAGQEQNLQLTGTLDLHGVKKEVTWDVKARKEGNVITALATTTFPFEDFNIPVLNIGGFVSVQDHITLQVQVVAQAS